MRPADRDMAGQAGLLDQVRQRHPGQHLAQGGYRDPDDVRSFALDIGNDDADFIAKDILYMADVLKTQQQM